LPQTTSSNRSAITISHLLNCLDGLGTRDGIVVVATANDPVDFDPALLKRPGRFDRLVPFPPPSPATRVEYLRRLTGGQPEQGFLATARDESDRLSFAQIREAYILAGQAALRRGRDIELEDLLDGLRRVRGEANCVRSKVDGTAVGFGTNLAVRPSETELVSRRP
jgi:ATP-dependent 26S proteasome regulatory subunit